MSDGKSSMGESYQIITPTPDELGWERDREVKGTPSLQFAKGRSLISTRSEQ